MLGRSLSGMLGFSLSFHNTPLPASCSPLLSKCLSAIDTPIPSPPAWCVVGVLCAQLASLIYFTNQLTLQLANLIYLTNQLTLQLAIIIYLTNQLTLHCTM